MVLRGEASSGESGVDLGKNNRHPLASNPAQPREDLQIQNLVAERLFQAYFSNGEDVSDPTTLRRIACEFGVRAISRAEDLDNPALVSEVKTSERKAASAGIRGVPQISLQGTIVANGAQKEELLADSILRILGTTGHCANGLCAV